MSSWFRIALMWLLAVALPVQGWAAVTMVNCGPSHHRMATQVAAGHDETAHDHHAIGSQVGHSHESPSSATADATNVGDDGIQQAKPDHHGLQKLSKFKCSACASCCLGVGLPSTVHTLNAVVSSDTVTPGMTPARVVFLTSGMERPPRLLLA